MTITELTKEVNFWKTRAEKLETKSYILVCGYEQLKLAESEDVRKHVKKVLELAKQ